jgi:ABC-2 type transport system ATP-binding protein
VARLSRDDGTTIFLTTQYLEEADRLADHLGIIDHGKIVAEGTTQGLKAEVGRPTVEAIPHESSDRERLAGVLDRFGELVPGNPSGAAVRLNDGPQELADIIRALDSEGIRIANIELHAASLNDVFLTKTGRSLEGAGEDDDQGDPGTGEQPVALEGSAA